MLTSLKVGRAGRSVAVALLLCGGAAISLQTASDVSAQTDGAVQAASLDPAAAYPAGDETAARDAAAAFVRSLAAGDAQAIWMFASEEDQDAFATEDAVLAAFAETFPALTQARSVTVDSMTQEGDTPFVQLSVADANGAQYKANVGLWLDDAGDWKVISCDVTPLTDRVASL